jgi:catechol 2,3-dioxygenase-like lactoylglutathione lyase family enzyme
MFTRIMYTKLSVADQDKSLEFYSKLGFEKKIDFPSPDGRFLTIGFGSQNSDLMLLKASKSNRIVSTEDVSIDPGILFVESDDLRKDFESLKVQGVEFIENEPVDYPWGIRITALDPDGNRIALRQQNK